MDGSDAALPAVAETVGFLAYFKDLADPRQQGEVTYPLEEVATAHTRLEDAHVRGKIVLTIA